VIFWSVSSLVVTNVSEDGGNMFPRNVSNHPQIYTESQRRLQWT